MSDNLIDSLSDISKSDLGKKKRKLLRQKKKIEREIERRQKVFDPTNYGLPDLKSIEQKEDESVEKFHERQDQALKEAVESNLFLYKDGEKNEIKLTGPYLEMASDLFYDRVQKAILWGPRGGGKSLVASVIIWLKMIYDRKSFTNIANSREQASVVYDYTKNFWYCVSDMAQSLLKKEPLKSETKLKGNVTLKCITASQKQARGKHSAGLVIDEAASDDKKTEEVFRAVMQGPMSEPDHTILITSTFHIPQGFFQEMWDNADEKGFKRYKADIFDCCLPDADVFTRNGIKKIKNVDLDDEVFTDSGEFKRVTDKIKKPSPEDRIRIKPYHFPDGVGITKGHRIKNDSGDWVRAGNLEEEDFIELPRPNINTEDHVYIDEIDLRFNDPVINKRKIDVNQDFLKWLGFFCGDGCANKDNYQNTHGSGREIIFTIGQDNRKYISWLKKLTEKCFNKTPKITREEDNYLHLTLSDRGLNKWLRSNCYDEDGDKKTPLNVIMNNPKSFLTGLFKSDGELPSDCNNKSNQIRFGFKSSKLVTDLLYCCMDLGFLPSLRQKNDYWFGSIGGKNAFDFISDVDENFKDKRSGERTWNHYKVQDDSIFVKIKDIVDLDHDGKVFDITVEDDHSFMTGFTMAHNSMSQCLKGMEKATDDDPKAIENHCMTDCPLTETKNEYNYKGEKKGEKVIGCKGKARDTHGHLSFDQVKSLKDQNEGTDVYEVEILCERPGEKQLVFPPEYIDGEDGAFCDLDKVFDEQGIELTSNDRKVVGLDWGFSDQLALVLAQRVDDHVAVTDAEFENGVIIDYVVNRVEEWAEEYGGDVFIFADNSNKMDNKELSTKYNIPTSSIHFGKHKQTMISNLNKYLVKQRLLIDNSLTTLKEQLKKYRRNSRGKIVKEDDHGVDALCLALLGFYYSEEFPNDHVDEQKVINEVQHKSKKKVENKEDTTEIRKF